MDLEPLVADFCMAEVTQSDTRTIPKMTIKMDSMVSEGKFEMITNTSRIVDKNGATLVAYFSQLGTKVSEPSSSKWRKIVKEHRFKVGFNSHYYKKSNR